MNDAIEQLQMGVSTTGTTLAHTASQGFYSGKLRWKNGRGKWWYTVNDKSFTVRKLSRFLQIFFKPRKFSLLNFCSSESSDMYKGGDGKNREIFPRIPDEPSKPRNFSPSKLLPFTVGNCTIYHFLTILHTEKGIPGAVTLNLYSRTQPSMIISIVSLLPQFDYGTS